MRENVKELVKEYNKTEDDLKALQVGILVLLTERGKIERMIERGSNYWGSTASTG